MERAPRNRPVWQYVALIVVFLAAVAYQARTAVDRFPQWFGGQGRAQWPVFLEADTAAPHFTIAYLKPNAKRAGLHERDVLLNINGRVVTGSGIFGDELAKAHPGDMMHIEVRSHGKTSRHAVVLTSAENSPLGFISVIGVLVMPVFCIVLGFSVAAIRPRDRLAWLLLVFLLGYTSFFSPQPELWGPIARDLGAVYHSGLDVSWSIWVLVFAIYFPEPISVGKPGRTVWKWVMWVVVLPLAFLSVANVIVEVGAIENYSSVFALNHLLAPVAPLFTIWYYTAIFGSIVCLGWKLRFAGSLDSRRRLKLVFIGSLISSLVWVLQVIAHLRHSEVEQLFPSGLYGTSYVLICVFPITIAYAIVVQRAMDVRLIIRQSLQYTLAKRGVIVLQGVLSAVLFSVVAFLITAHKLGYAGTVIVMAAGLWSIFLLNGVSHRFARVIDRRFFRETYNAEQILSELAERVRTIVESDTLLATVTGRISEALHVSRMAVLLNGSGPYQPACALGYSSLPDVSVPENAPIAEELRKEKRPVRVYFDDPNSWIYRSPAMTAEDREQLAQLAPELLLPLLVKDELIGFMSLGQKLSEASYSGSDIGLLNSVASQTSLALEVSRLTTKISAEAAHRERLNRELEIAREVQQKLFPSRLPAVPGLDYCAECRPAREVGGDYYDFLELPDGKFGIALGDISGKGIGAALMMANLQASLRGQAPILRNMPELLKRVNGMLYEASSFNRYATFFYAEYDPETRALTYVNAGHNPPVVLRHCEILRWETGGPVIGLLPQVEFQQGTVQLEPGDLAVLYTDGVSESMNLEDEEWSEERLIACVKTCYHLSARGALDRIMNGAVAFAAGAPQHDDMTLTVLRVAESA
ncbi:MAG TPA: SpoIIE family protein phosphatase [Bryobacteraceae bacterium]